MNSKLTTEEKARIFALYLGTKVIIKWKSEEIICDIINVGLTSMYITGKSSDGTTYNSYGINEAKLLLTPLSSISDEDAIEVAKIGNNHLNSGVNVVGNIYRDSFGVTIMFNGENGNPFYSKFIIAFNGNIVSGKFPAINQFSIFQYLISRQYAVPLYFGVDHPCNGKTAIELGIAIQKQ